MDNRKKNKDNNDYSLKHGSERTHTTVGSMQSHNTTEIAPGTSTTTPFHLFDSNNNNNNKNQKNNSNINDDTISVSSYISLSSTTDGIDVLGSEKSPTNFKQYSHLFAARIVCNQYYKRFVLFLILLCCFLLAIRTTDYIRDNDNYNTHNNYWNIINITLDIILILYTIEIILMIAYYQEQIIITIGWYTVDIILVVITYIIHDKSILVLRGLRIIRTLRKATGIPTLKYLIKILLRVIPKILIIIGILLPIIFIIFSILFTNLYQTTFDDDDDDTEEYFYRLDHTAWILFEIMTGGRNYSNIINDLETNHPYIWIPMLLFIIISMFFFGSLIIAVMVDAVRTSRDEQRFWGNITTTQQPSQAQLLQNKQISSISMHLLPDVTELYPQFMEQNAAAASNNNNNADDAVTNIDTMLRLERKVEDLSHTVDTLLHLHVAMQESINKLILIQQQRDMTNRINNTLMTTTTMSTIQQQTTTTAAVVANNIITNVNNATTSVPPPTTTTSEGGGGDTTSISHTTLTTKPSHEFD